MPTGLIVIETEIFFEIDVLEQGFHIGERIDGDAFAPDLRPRSSDDRNRTPSASAYRNPSRCRSDPGAIRYLKRLLVSSPVPKPAIWRIVQFRERYIVGYGPRVNG